MEANFIKEEEDYSFEDIQTFFSLDDIDKTKNLINKLKNKHILVSVNNLAKNKDLSEIDWFEVENDVETNSSEKRYKFNYVGLLYINNVLIKCYPKYYSKEPDLPEYKQILKVIERYKNKKLLNLNSNISTDYKKDFNELELSLYLINDYISNGLYINQQWVIKKNVNGEIDWNRTINNTSPIIQEDNPVYVDLYNRKKVDNNKEFITILHKSILTEISNKFKVTGINTLFDLDDINLSNDSVSDLGDTNYILYRIESELHRQFNSEKQLLLKGLYTYVSKSETQNKDNDLLMYGTNSMHSVWEDVCKQALGDDLDSRVSDITTISSQYDNFKLKDIIEKPFWIYANREANDTLIPDIVILNDKDKSMYIIDAKYYTPNLDINTQPTKQPGIDSVIKQFMYQLAYKDFCNDVSIEFKGNYFIMPTEEKEVINKGEVSMNMMKGLNNIIVRYVPATEFYECYLRNQLYDLDKLI